MRIVMFNHSLVSDWNYGHAHFLRGIVTELLARGHDVQVYEPRDSLSRQNLERDHGVEAVRAFHDAYPVLSTNEYDRDSFDPARVLAGADLVIVHERNDPSLIARISTHRRRVGGYVLLFHDTHHRSISDPASLAAFDLREYDGVLASGDAVTHMYIERGWSRHAWTWHEAADTRVFYPHRPLLPPPGPGAAAEDDDGDLEPPLAIAPPYDGDVVWIGNFGDGERTAELDAFLVEPVRRLGARAVVYGVGYPDDAIAMLAAAGIEYRGWLANFQVPEVFAHYKVTVHIPRAPYVASLPGIPTIRPFEAAACGIPFVSAQWSAAGGLFTPGEDFLVARDTEEMTAHLEALLNSPRLRYGLATHALQTVQSRHTCAHRADELMAIYDGLRRGQECDATVAPLLAPAS